MAAPAEVNILDLTGVWVMNKSLSDSTEEMLTLQGVPWFKRKIINAATVTLYTKHYKDDNSTEHIDIRQTVAGMEGNSENRTLDWTIREQVNNLFGPVKGRSRRVKLEEIDMPWLKDHYLPEITEQGAIQAVADSDTEKSGTTWSTNQTWGFEEIDGQRRHVRRLNFIGPKDEHLQMRLVYDYTGKNE